MRQRVNIQDASESIALRKELKNRFSAQRFGQEILTEETTKAFSGVTDIINKSNTGRIDQLAATNTNLITALEQKIRDNAALSSTKADQLAQLAELVRIRDEIRGLSSGVLGSALGLSTGTPAAPAGPSSPAGPPTPAPAAPAGPSSPAGPSAIDLLPPPRINEVSRYEPFAGVFYSLQKGKGDPLYTIKKSGKNYLIALPEENYFRSGRYKRAPSNDFPPIKILTINDPPNGLKNLIFHPSSVKGATPNTLTEDVHFTNSDLAKYQQIMAKLPLLNVGSVQGVSPKRLLTGYVSPINKADVVHPEYTEAMRAKSMSGSGIKKMKKMCTKSYPPKCYYGAGMINASPQDITDRMTLIIGSMSAGNTSKILKNELSDLADYQLKAKKITKKVHKQIFSKYIL